MSTEEDHICKDLHSENLKISKCVRTEGFKNLSRNKQLFTCGACLTKFKTVCLLHVHLQGHDEGGSYTYDHITRTAFPKYDSVCACTQVEQNFVVLITQRLKNSGKKSNINELKRDKIQKNKEAATRKSKRIALRQSKNQENSEETEKKRVDSNVNTTEIKQERQAKNDLTSECRDMITGESEKSRDLKSQRYKKIKSDSQTKKRKTGKEDSLQASVDNDSEMKSPETEEQLMNIDKKDKIVTLHKIPIDRKTKVMLENLKIEEQKTDEITASEALIAISKSVNSKDIKNTTKSETHDSRTNISGHQSRVSDRSETETGTSRAIQSKQGTIRLLNAEHSFHNEGETIDSNKPSKQLDILCSKVGEESVEYSHQEEQPKLVQQSDKHKCPVCGKLGTRGMLSYHKYLHKDEKELSCDKCGKQFQHPTCLKVHLRSHEEKLYKCTQCSTAFSRRKYLETHMLKHSGEKPYMCETCGKAYRNEMHLKRHINNAHKQIRNFECDICKERFFRSDHLKCHKMRHFEPGLRCPFCNKKFKLPADLKRHSVIHTGLKIWHCHLCGHGFRYPIPYYNHMKKKHDMDRNEAGIWRKKLIEENKRDKEQNYNHTTVTLGLTEKNPDIQAAQNLEAMSNSEVSFSENSEVSGVNVEVSNGESFSRKVHVEQGTVVTDTSGDGVNIQTLQQDKQIDSENNAVYNGSVNTSAEKPHWVYIQSTSKGYRYIRVSNFTSQKSIKIHPQSAQNAEQGLHFPLKEAYPVAEDSGIGTHGIVGLEGGSRLQDEQMVVMGEEIVTDDICALPSLEGGNIQAVMFMDENECAGEVVIDEEMTL